MASRQLRTRQPRRPANRPRAAPARRPGAARRWGPSARRRDPRRDRRRGLRQLASIQGRQRLNAGFRYPSGTLHGAWDIGIDRGTKVYAAKDAIVVGRHDGVRNHPSGSAYAVSGSPSNWVLLCAKVSGKPSVLYYQHLSPGLKVSRPEGQARPVARAFRQHREQHGRPPPSQRLDLALELRKDRPGSAPTRFATATSQPQRADLRPEQVLERSQAAPVISASAIAAACRTEGGSARHQAGQKALGIPPTNDVCTTKLRVAYRKYQRSLGLRGKAADGIPGKASLKVLAKRNGWRVTP